MGLGPHRFADHGVAGADVADFDWQHEAHRVQPGRGRACRSGLDGDSRGLVVYEVQVMLDGSLGTEDQRLCGGAWSQPGQHLGW
jgi:hypothetical protein